MNTSPATVCQQAEILETSTMQEFQNFVQEIQGNEICSSLESASSQIAKIDTDWHPNMNELQHVLNEFSAQGLDTTAYMILFNMISNLRQQVCLERNHLYYSLLQNVEEKHREAEKKAEKKRKQSLARRKKAEAKNLIVEKKRKIPKKKIVENFE